MKDIKKRAEKALWLDRKATVKPWTVEPGGSPELGRMLPGIYAGRELVTQLTLSRYRSIPPKNNSMSSANADFITQARTDLADFARIVLAVCKWREHMGDPVSYPYVVEDREMVDSILAEKGPHDD